MKNSITEVPDAVALTYDRDHKNTPDWEAIKAAANEKHPGLNTDTVIDRVQTLWETPEKFAHASKLRIRDGHSLVIGGGNTKTASEDRKVVAQFKELGVHAKAGFDGVSACGTWDGQFAWWLTPAEIWNEIEESEIHDPADFEQGAIEDAVRHMTGNTDRSWEMFNEMRQDVINDAEHRSRVIRGTVSIRN